MSLPKTIAIQGEIGSNHYILSRLLFPTIKDERMLCANSFAQLCLAVENETVDVGLMAIENSIAGSIVSVYDLLSLHNLHVIGEAYLPIHHCLIGLPKASLQDITTVYSHEMALRQCEKFLTAHHLESREYFDTAAAAPHVKQLKDTRVAAIAPKIAAQIHGMKILAENIETEKENYTRFLIVSKSMQSLSQELVSHKVLCECTLAHTPGSLATLLTFLANEDCNLTKIESRPILGKPWEYRFFIDFLTQKSEIGIQEIIHNMKNYTTTIRIHGLIEEGKVLSV